MKYYTEPRRRQPDLQLKYLWFRLWFFGSLLILAALMGCPYASADGGRPLSLEEQRVLYQAQQLMADQKDVRAGEMLSNYLNEQKQNCHYLVPFTLGNALARQGKNSGALACYRLAVQRHSQDAAVWRNMGKVCFDLKQYDQAAEYMLRARALVTENEPELVFQAAVCRMLSKKPHKALPLLEEICTRPLRQVKADWLQTLANAYIETGQSAKAVGALQKIIRQDGDTPRWWKVLAHVYMRLKEYRNAAAAFQIHLDLTAGAGQSKKEDLILLADLYRLADVPLKAAWQYEKAASLSARPADYQKIASAYMVAHRPDKAAVWLRKGLAQQPDAGLYRMLGRLLYNQGQYAESYQSLARSIQAAPNDGHSALIMGYCAVHMDRLEKARSAFQAAARFSEHREAAHKALKQIDRLIRQRRAEGKSG